MGDAGLVRQDLLGAKREANAVLGGQPQRFVHAVGVQRLGSPKHRRERLDGHANGVVVRLLSCQGGAGGLCMEAQGPGPGVPGVETLAGYSSPEAPGGAEFSNLFQKVVVCVEPASRMW